MYSSHMYVARAYERGVQPVHCSGAQELRRGPKEVRTRERKGEGKRKKERKKEKERERKGKKKEGKKERKERNDGEGIYESLYAHFVDLLEKSLSDWGPQRGLVPPCKISLGGPADQ